jgi:hypothetical protein
MTDSPSELIDEDAELDDWRDETLARVRALVKEADPAVARLRSKRGPPWGKKWGKKPHGLQPIPADLDLAETA